MRWEGGCKRGVDCDRTGSPKGLASACDRAMAFAAEQKLQVHCVLGVIWGGQ